MTPEDRIYWAIVLNEPYAGLVKDKKKTIETRMRNLTQLVGDIVICCDGGKSKYSKNAGRALCIVSVEKGRPMTEQDAEGACIECVPKRVAYPLSDWRYFSYDFLFTDYFIDGTYQGLFRIKIPPSVTIHSK